MNDHEYKPEGIIANLQAQFAVMEFSNRKAVDPNDFITKLGLDPAVQQDAQEFCKLFQGVLESKLSSQINATVKGMIQVWSFAQQFLNKNVIFLLFFHFAFPHLEPHIFWTLFRHPGILKVPTF